MSAEVYVELELHGPADQAVGFIEGFRAAVDAPGPAWYSERENIDLESLYEALREKLSRGCHVILPRPTAEAIAAALEESEIVEVKVASMSDIDYAEMRFDYRCYSRSDGEAVRKVVTEDLPGGVRLEGFSAHEERDDSARGVELYSPAHDYTCWGDGRYVGPVDGIFALDRRLGDQDFIHPGKIRLHHPS
jgi:hypothetical protein